METTLAPQVARTRATLQAQVRHEIAQRSMSPEQLAGLLGLLPVGVEVLLAHPDWSLDMSLQIADALGLEVEFKLKKIR